MKKLFLESGSEIVIPEIKYRKEILILSSLLMVNDEKIDINKKFLTYFGDSMLVGMDISNTLKDQEAIRMKLKLHYDVNYADKSALIHEDEDINPYVTFHDVKFGKEYIKGYNLLITNKDNM